MNTNYVVAMNNTQLGENPSLYCGKKVIVSINGQRSDMALFIGDGCQRCGVGSSLSTIWNAEGAPGLDFSYTVLSKLSEGSACSDGHIAVSWEILDESIYDFDDSSSGSLSASGSTDFDVAAVQPLAQSVAPTMTVASDGRLDVSSTTCSDNSGWPPSIAMADPLSIAAGISGFLSLGIQVTQALVDFYSVYKSQDTELVKLTQNIENLQDTFRSLEVAVHQRQSQGDAEELLQEVDKATQRCQEVIKELQIECQRFHAGAIPGFKGHVQVAGRRAAYPFRRSTMQKIQEDIGDIRENLSFALDVLQFKSHKRIEDELSDVKSVVERINLNQISLAIRAWLVAPDASANHNAIYAKHHPNTGLWLINSHDFANWLKERNSFLWLNGFAGCGKSVLCSIAIQNTFREMKHRIGVGIAFFYFSFNDKSKQDDHGMLRALLLQLSVQFQDGEKELEQLHMLFKSSTPSVETLLQTLQKFLVQFQGSYILLDALDECPRDHGREAILRVIKAIRDWRLPSVHLLVTSRDQFDIRRSLNPSCDSDLPMNNTGIEKDITDFVTYQLENDFKLQRWNARHNEMKERLLQGAQGVFRYVQCQLDSFRRARNRNQLDECLRTLPRDLDETYERILCNIDETYVEDVRRILTVLCLSTRLLTINELIDAHAIELDEHPCLDREGRSYEQDDLVDICLGLVEIVVTKDSDGQIISTARIAHFSIQEYLQSDRIQQQKAKRFAILSGSANTEMAQICLAYLLDPTLSDGILNEIKLREYQLAQFAAIHWYHYYKRSQEGKSKAEKLLSRIFQDNTNSFVTWIKLHDIDRPGCHEKVDFWRRIDDIASPMYYASLLGLKIILENMLVIATRTATLSDTVNAEGGYYGNALQAASYNGHKEVVHMLLDRGAAINTQYGNYGNALQAASYNGHKEVVHMLLGRGADINAQGGEHNNSLQAASYRGHEEVVQILLDGGANANSQGSGFHNALQAASDAGHKEVVLMLLDRGADINTQGGFFGNALQAASESSRQGVMQTLLDRGADINAQGGYFGSSLQAASYRGRREPVQMLLERGAEVNAQGGRHYGNALQAASYGGHKEVVQMLLGRGAEVNAQGGHYGNALQAASYGGHEEVVQMLLDRGASRDSR
ncbi:NACHT nucleoside triphosphatase [Penicillium atrosanguineum]|nr:NACHT nucleoside triphosphatase [Penicillium atrosanguineum]